VTPSPSSDKHPNLQETENCRHLKALRLRPWSVSARFCGGSSLICRPVDRWFGQCFNQRQEGWRHYRR
jgi:hypothetical protein